jgi:hypothetical protein
MNRDEPRHVHVCTDCADCAWLGCGGTYDFYMCTSEARGVVLIARYGSRAFDYASLSLRNCRTEPENLVEPFRAAYMRARERGLLP